MVGSIIYMEGAERFDWQRQGYKPADYQQAEPTGKQALPRSKPAKPMGKPQTDSRLRTIERSAQNCPNGSAARDANSHFCLQYQLAKVIISLKLGQSTLRNLL